MCGIQNVFMVHALKRISYATCNPALCQFSFLARNRKAPPGLQCCHVFFTGTPQEVVITYFMTHFLLLSLATVFWSVITAHKLHCVSKKRAPFLFLL